MSEMRRGLCKTSAPVFSKMLKWSSDRLANLPEKLAPVPAWILDRPFNHRHRNNDAVAH